MKTIFFLTISAVLLASCGQNVVPGVRRKPIEAANTCPNLLRQPQEELTLLFGAPPPAHIAVDISGQRKYSECGTLRAPPPMVKVERLSGNRLSIKVQRLEKRRADEIIFSVKDLKDCAAPEEDLIKEEHAAIRYMMEYPDGPNCPGQPVAKMELVR